MKAVILAGGLGSRLKPFTEVIPKPLMPLGDKAITEIQIGQLREAGCTDVYLATNYKSDYIAGFLGDGSRYGLRLHYSVEEKPLGTCGPLSLLKQELTEPFLMMNGDILTKLDFAEIYASTIAQSPILNVGTKIISTPFRFGHVVTEGQRITSVQEKPEFNIEIIAGVYGFHPGIFDFIPDDLYFGMDTLIEKLLREGKEIGRFLIKDYWLDIGQVEDYGTARKAYEDHFS